MATGNGSQTLIENKSQKVAPIYLEISNRLYCIAQESSKYIMTLHNMSSFHLTMRSQFNEFCGKYGRVSLKHIYDI